MVFASGVCVVVGLLHVGVLGWVGLVLRAGMRLMDEVGILVWFLALYA